MTSPSELKEIPVTYNDINLYFNQIGEVNPFHLREETIKRIEKSTERPLICYLSKTVNVPPEVPVYIDDGDIRGFSDLLTNLTGKEIDVLVVSNGGIAESTERIVRLLRAKFENVRFILPGNAYSAATMLSFSGDEILMGLSSTLGPIDPQIGGVPARAIRKAFDDVVELLKEQGPNALTAYMPLLSNYDLPLLEICKNAQRLSRELAIDWLSTYMLKCSGDDAKVKEIVDFFCDYDLHKSHGRSIDFNKAEELGLSVTNLEQTEINELVCSLYNQYELFFDNTPFYKLYENTRGISWGRQTGSISIPQPIIDQNPPPPTKPGIPDQGNE